MASELCMNCFSVKGAYEVCPYCGYAEGTPPKQPHYLTPGTVLGDHFIVGTVIGVGGFGITYKCFDITLGVTVAVKEFFPLGLVNRAPGERHVGLLSGDKREQYKNRLKRFLLEAQSVAQYGKAKDIVNVYDYFEENGTAYIIMEYIDGILLKDYLEKQAPMDPEAAISIIMLIIEAVKKIHSKGIIHRDVSPDNIFIVNENSIKIFDFGAAQLNDTVTGMSVEPVIKVGYSPLEQYRNNNKQGFYTDVYAVGAILYQMLTGAVPVESTEREFKDCLKSPMEAGAKISANVDRAVMEALAVRHELRFQNIQQFQDALQNKRIAEYPKEKLRKKNKKRNTIIGISAVLAVGVVVVIGLYSSFLKPKNRIFDSVIDSATEISVWVENKGQKEWVQELIEGAFQTGKTPSEDEELRKIQKQNENVNIKIKVIGDMDQSMRKAKEKGKLPNMVLSDHITHLEEYNPISLTDNYELMHPEKYIYMSAYEKYFPDMKEMPTGINTLHLYAAKIDYHKSNRVESSEIEAAKKHPNTKVKTVELNELLKSADVKEQEIWTGTQTFLRRGAVGTALLLEDEAWRNVFTGNELPTSGMLKSLQAMQKSRNEAYNIAYELNSEVDPEDGVIIDTGIVEKGMYGSNILSGITYRTKMNAAVENANKDTGTKYANPISNYQSYVVTHDDKMLVIYSDRYAILNQGSEEQKTACMRLLWVMLEEAGQAKKIASKNGTYPILRSSFEEFPKYNAGYSDFIELEKAATPCVLIGGESGSVLDYVEGLEKRMTQEELREYSKKYIKTRRKNS